MIKEANGFGATLEEAKENAMLKLNASELDDIQFEVITMPKKKVLGMFGGNSAEVRAFMEVPDEKPPKKPQKPQKSQPKKDDKKEEKKEDKKEKIAVTAKEEKPAVKEEKAEITAIEVIADDYGEPVDESQIPADSPAAKAIAYIRNFLKSANCKDVKISVASKENASMIMLDGEDISIIIGRRGETLDALQYLASLAANNGGGHYKISLNIGNYREKRAETLISLANRISAQVIKTGKSRALEPMNPYERRIIHTAVQGIAGVDSKSFGEGVGRRIVIFAEGSEVRPPHTNDRRNFQRRERSHKPQSAPAPAREPKKDSDIPLYGKIN